MFTLTIFKVLLFEGRLVLSPAQRGTKSERVKVVRVVYILEVLKHFTHWDIFWSGGIETLWAKTWGKKSFELYQVFMYNFLCKTVLILIYIFLTKFIETFWSRDVTDIWLLAHFEIKIYKYFWIYHVFIC